MNTNRYLVRKTHTGFSMLEVLISVFILSIGLLGLITLQMTSLKNNQSAQHRTTATVLAYDMLDKIRLNKTADYSLSMTADPSSTSGSNGNSQLSQKDNDLIAWRKQLKEQLPSGKGSIEIKNKIATINVQWNDSRGLKGEKEQTFSVSTQYE